MDILLAHGYFLAEDEHERKVIEKRVALRPSLRAGGESGIDPKAPPIETSRPPGASACRLFW